MTGSKQRDLNESAGWFTGPQPEARRDLTGRTLGDFRIEKLLGQGGMGEVYLAIQRSLNRPVALKVLRADVSSNTDYMARLRSEATAIARLNHPNIVHVYTMDTVEDTPFIAMEYVPGTNLKEYLRKKGALELPLALSVMRQTAQAVQAAGELGLVHRDLKPENILLTRKGRVKVADFGLCRIRDGQNLALTQTGVTMGTPLYMSPEQSQGQEVDHRSDLYSLGVTYYQMLTGEPPFQADTPLAIALKHIREAPRSMRVHRPDLPPELDRVVLKLLRKPPGERYQSAAELLADLGRLRDGSPVLPGVAAGESAPRTEAVEETEDRLGSASAPLARSGLSSPLGSGAVTVTLPLPGLRPFLAFVAGVACLLLGVVTGYVSRSADIQAMTAHSAAMPGLWLEPRWTEIAKQPTAQAQYRHAQLAAPRAELAAAWMAVPGHFPHSRETVTKAYTQLVRIYFRRHDLPALEALEKEFAALKDPPRRDLELLEILRIAIKDLRGDLEGVVDGMKQFSRDGAGDVFDPALLELGLEICNDAGRTIGTQAQSMAMQPLLASQRILLMRLYRIEVRQQPLRKSGGGAPRPPAPDAGALALPLDRLTAWRSFQPLVPEDRFVWPT